jgi:cytochrome P450
MAGIGAEDASAPPSDQGNASVPSVPSVPSNPSDRFAPFDPFELKDLVSGNIRDPYPVLHELRRQSPVHAGPIDLGEGAEIADPHRPPPVTVFGFDEVVQVLKDNETFSSSVYTGVMGMVMGRTILEMDEPDHRVARALVAPTFRSKMLERWEAGLVALVVNELVDTFIDAGRADLVREVTFNYPVQVIARILGLPRADYPSFQRWAIELTSVAANWERGVAASTALRDYFAAVMAERRQSPGDDLISELLAVEVDGIRLSDEEMYSFLRLLLPAGVETTYRASGNLLLALLSDRAQFDALYADRSLYPQAFEEALRWEPPVTVILRRATRDTELAGVAIDEGADVALLLGAANRDERKYPDPDRFDLFRTMRQHVGFGFGVHVCLGMHLARMESRVAITTLLDRLGPFTLDPSVEAPHIEGMAFRSPLSLPVVFDRR